MTQNATPQVVTFGCRLNNYESEVIKSHLLEHKLSNVVVFNSCSVTAEAERQVRQSIRKTKRDNPTAQIIVTGCSAQINPKAYETMDEVDLVLGNQEKMQADSYKRAHFDLGADEKVLVNDIMSVKETASHLVQGFEGKVRAFVQVQNGCNHRCTFCIIPYGRGNSRSVPIGEIVSQVQTLVDNGYKEVVLTGVDISDYGKDLPGSPSLGEMVQRLLNLAPELKRLRISSIDVAEIDDSLFNLLCDEPRVMPHIHISLQAGDDMVLKRMKRRHNRKQVVEFCEAVRSRRSDVLFGADIIAGFPTEDETMFDNTLRLVNEAGLSFLHVFPYSEREGTPAARIPNQVPVPTRKARAAALRDAGQQQLLQAMQRKIGQEFEVLVEQENLARCEDYVPVQLNTSQEAGRLVRVRGVQLDGDRLQAEVL